MLDEPTGTAQRVGWQRLTLIKALFEGNNVDWPGCKSPVQVALVIHPNAAVQSIHPLV